MPYSSFVARALPLVLLSASVHAQSNEAVSVRKLNALLDAELSGDVRYTRLSPDGEWAVYFADLDSDEAFDLYSVRTDGASSPHELAGPLVPGVLEVVIAPDSARVLYRVGWNLFSVPIDGSAPGQQLTALPGFARASSYLISADSSLALYIADQEVDGRYELFVVPLDASSPPLKLSQPSGLSAVNGIRLDPGGGATLYTMSLGTGSCLFRVPLSGGTPVQLTPHGVFDQHLLATGDGSHALYYNYNFDGSQDYHLLTVPLDGSAAPVVVATEDSQPNALEVSPDSSRVVYTFDDATLYSAPADGSAPGNLITNNLTSEFRITADSARVVYRRGYNFGHDMLASRVLDASQAEVRLDASDRVRDFALGATLVAYRAYADGGGDDQLFVAPPDGSAAPVRLDVGTGDVTSFTLAPDGQHVAYTKNDELFLAPTSGATPPVLLASRGTAPLFTPARVVFDAVNDEEANELFSVPLSGGTTVRLSLPFVDTHTVVDVRRLDTEGRWAVFQIGQGDVEEELWCARLDAPGSAFRVEGPRIHNIVNGGSPWGVALSAGTERLVYHAATDSRLYTVELAGSPMAQALPGPALGSPNGQVPFLVDPSGTRAVYREANGGLRSVLLDGSAEPDLLAASCEWGFQITSDGERVVFRAIATGRFRLFSVLLDGSAPAVQLSPAAASSVSEFRVSSGGDHVAFRAGALYGAPTGGSAPAVQLSPTINAGFEREVNFRLTASGVVVFLDGEPEDLYAVPVDGSASPILLGTTSALTIPQFELTSDGERVVYLAPGGPLFRIFSARVDGIGEPLNLSGGLPVPYDGFQLSPDGARVVFPATLARHLYSAPVDVAGAPVALHPTPPPGSSVPSFRILPGSRHVVFTSDGASAGQDQLYLTSILGSAWPVRLNSPLVAGGDVTSGKFEPTPQGVVYVADGDQDDVFELYLTSLRRLAPFAPPPH